MRVHKFNVLFVLTAKLLGDGARKKNGNLALQNASFVCR